MPRWCLVPSLVLLLGAWCTGLVACCCTCLHRSLRTLVLHAGDNCESV